MLILNNSYLVAGIIVVVLHSEIRELRFKYKKRIITIIIGDFTIGKG